MLFEDFVSASTQDLLVLGRRISERLSPTERVNLGRHLLQVALSHPHVAGIADDAVRVLADVNTWGSSRDVVQRIRQQLLAAERAGNQSFDVGLLHLSELVAKMAFNATAPLVPFDEDTPYWLPHCVQFLVRELSGGELKKNLISVLLAANERE